MNIDILKQRPIPQEKQQFELLLPDKKPVTIVDKRGDVNIDRHSILERIRNRVVVQKEEPHSLPVATKKKSNKQPDENIRLKMYEVIEKHINRCPIKLENVFDLLWWINFSIKWEYVNRRIFVLFYKNINLHKNYSFFNTQDFQKWSLANHSIKHKNTWMTYKQPAKDFIKRITTITYSTNTY